MRTARRGDLLYTKSPLLSRWSHAHICVRRVAPGDSAAVGALAISLREFRLVLDSAASSGSPPTPARAAHRTRPSHHNLRPKCPRRFTDAAVKVLADVEATSRSLYRSASWQHRARFVRTTAEAPLSLIVNDSMQLFNLCWRKRLTFRLRTSPNKKRKCPNFDDGAPFAVGIGIGRSIIVSVEFG